jgi:hypothetical protein
MCLNDHCTVFTSVEFSEVFGHRERNSDYFFVSNLNIKNCEQLHGKSLELQGLIRKKKVKNNCHRKCEFVMIK